MKELTLEIKPKEGFGELAFGDVTERVTDYLGKPEEIENIEDDDLFNTTILNYWEKGISVFFEGSEKSVIACFETDHPDSILYGERVFDLNEMEIKNLMSGKGFELAEEELEESGEKRLSYDDAMIDFFFEEDELIAVNWGVLVNEHGEIEEMPA